MGAISSKIDLIIETRNSKVRFVEKALEDLNCCMSAVNRLEAKQAACINGTFNTDAEVMERIKAISFKNFYNSAKGYKEKLEKLKSRFSRKSLHISLVGRARMGKSLVIQKITGLDGSIIPSSAGSDCTGTKSIITNSDNEEVCAEITFYSEYELVGIINTYLENILHNNSKNIGSISQISSIPVDEIKPNYSQVKENQYLSHLKKYVENIDIFADFLGKTKKVEKNEIEKYVAQYNHTDPNQKYYYFLGVKSANILTKFPIEDSGKIVLLDTIGIGTTSLGVEDSMLDIVENDSDAIVFMFRPDSLGPRLSEDEIEVIDKISKRVGSEYSKEMLFWIINKVVDGKGKNIDFIQGVMDQIYSANFPVSEVFQVDCMDEKAVEQEMLLPILEKISSKIHDVDKLIVESAQVEGNNVFAEYASICMAIDKIFMNCISEDMKRVWYPQIKGIRDHILKNGLRDLYIQTYNDLRNEPCEELKIASEKVLQKLFSFVPTVQSVTDILNKGKNQHDALMICYDRMRLNIIDAFMSLDSDLHKLVSSMKNEVLDIFRNEDKGRLKLLIGNEIENDDPNIWIDAFLTKTEAAEKYPTLASAFEKFKNFECTVQGFLIYEVRDKLNIIDEALVTQLPKIYAGLTNKAKIAEELVEMLNDRISVIHNELRSVLNALYKVPNRAMYAAITDLYDRAFLENRDSMGDYEVETQWEYLYEDWMHILWKEEYEKEMSTQNKVRELNDIVNEIKKYNNRSIFEIKFN